MGAEVSDGQDVFVAFHRFRDLFNVDWGQQLGFAFA